MSDTVGAIAAALHADVEAMRVVSLNVANAQTPAYRREISVARMEYPDAADSLRSPTFATAVDPRAGTLQGTAQPLDLAIEGKGFFVVSTARGEMLTRRGDFRLDADGRVVTQSGDVVLGTGGAIVVGDQRPTVALDGTVRAGDAVIDRLRIVQVESEATLTPAGNGTYTLPEGVEAIDTPGARVRQGFLETSNVESVNETVQMMDVMRRLEMAQRFMRGYDSMMEQAITTLGRP